MRRFTLMLCIAVAATSAYAQNSGWLVPQKKVKLMTYYGRYHANAYKDSDGNASDYANEGKFTSDYFKIAAEYGLSNNLNLYASLPLVYNAQTSSLARSHTFAPGDSELGLSANLKKWTRTYLMGSVNVGMPLYSKKSIPGIGLGEFSAATSLKYCGSIDHAYAFFFAIEQGLRLYFDGTLWWSNAFQLGYNITKKHALVAEISGMKSFDNGLFDASPNANRSAFFYEKAALGYYYKATDKIQVGGTVWGDFMNRNSSVGKGFSAIAIVLF